MRLATPFDPIEVGEIDNFTFDFTADMGAATMVSTNWTCALAPFQTATDPAPQSRVLSVSTRRRSRCARQPMGRCKPVRGSFRWPRSAACRPRRPAPPILSKRRLL